MNSMPMEQWSLSHKGRLQLSFTLPDDLLDKDATLIIVQREDGTGEWTPESTGLRNELPLIAGDKRGSYHADVDLASLQWHNARWDIVILVGEQGEPLLERTPYELKFTRAQRRELYRHAYQSYLPENAIAIPYLTSRRTLALIYRERAWYDSPRYHKTELAAWFTWRAFKKQLTKRRIWIVYEKQSERAQDNGFYFFKWCMENLPPEERKRIYFVMNPHSADYERVKPYGRNVLKLMSYRQFLYCIAAEMLVGSET